MRPTPSKRLRRSRRIHLALAGASLLAATSATLAQTAPASPATQTASAGGTITGTIKAGAVPLPGVAVTATNTLTGKKYATTTDIDGNYAMAIPKTGRYVVRAELAAFAPVTSEVKITAEAADQKAPFTLQLASRAAAQSAAQSTTQVAEAVGRAVASSQQGRGTQALNLSGESGLEAASPGGAATQDVSAPTLSGLESGDSIAVNGVQGSTNGLANLNEDQLRDRIGDAINQVRQNGGSQADQLTNAATLIQGIMQGGGFGPGGGGPGGRGGPGGGGGARGGPGGGGGFGNFRNFNPAQPHGNIFYQGANNALNSAQWQPDLLPQVNPAGYQNRFGASIAGVPYLPHLTKPDTRQFVFLNLSGQRNLSAYAPTPVRVPTDLERTGDFSQSLQRTNTGAVAPVTLYDPTTGMTSGPNLKAANVLNPAALSPQALALLNYYPHCNINCTSTDPSVYNYQTVANSGTNSTQINARYQRQLGAKSAATGPFGFGGGGGGRGGGGGGQRGQNAKPTLRQSINAQYGYSHSANDNRNIFLPLGGRTATDGNSLNVGYTLSYGRLSNNASVNWNRSNSKVSNYFTDTAVNPATSAGLSVPNQTSSFADPRFYNGLPSIGISNFASLATNSPSETINQTISFSDFVAWRHKRHNYRFGGDIRRVHDDSIGGNNPLGSLSFTGYATANPADQVASLGGTNSGSGFADFLLGLPGSSSIQAGKFKEYLRENALDWYAQDDWRIKSNVTLNLGLRYEYFGPYSEKYGRLVNLDHDASFSTASIKQVTPGQNGYGNGLVNPDYLLYAPRFGFAWSPKIKNVKNLVIRGGYGVNYNTGQYAQFALKLSHQAPFSATQNNSPYIPTLTNPSPSPTGCNTTQAAYAPIHRGATVANMTLANAFNCSTADTITNNWAVDPNYKLGLVQIYNLNIQKTFGAGIVANIGYNGAHGSNLDAVGSPNANPSGVQTPGVAAFDYEESAASSRSNSLVVSVQQRQHKGIALGATYTYLHAIDNASGVGGAVGTPVQDFYHLNLEEGNSSFDQRHNLAGTYLIELPFGPNRAFLNKGGWLARVMDGYSLSGSFTFASGNYFTPGYSNNQSEAAAAGTFNQRPNRVIGQPITGPGKLKEFFNTAAFTAPPSGQYGTASQGSIEGPGTVSTVAVLSRTVTLGDTRSFEARVQANNVFNTVQYNSIGINENASNFGQVTGAAAMRTVTFIARYRF